MSAGDNPCKNFFIVGIGASAGGLDALQRFLSVLPQDFGFALVFIQHLSAKHKSLLQELLSARRPSLVIQQISDGLKIQPGRLYLAPPGREVRLRNGLFQTTAHVEGLVHLPIDEFLSSLAEDAGERSIAVIFSGAGTDGARGCKAVRSVGGTVFTQDPQTAEFDSMPLAAIATGQADAVLAPEDVAVELLKLQGMDVAAVRREYPITPEEYESFFQLLDEKTGSRFNHYKKSVVSRRIRRRMYLHGFSTVKDYLDLISASEPEAAHLASDLMIGVTSFFRDRVAWRALNVEAIRRFVAEDTPLPVRVWTPASATGEEAYSIAMMLLQELSLAGKKRDIQVFATDVNDRALERAREGKYPASIVADVPEEFIRKYFTSTDDGNFFLVNKDVRECVVFAKQDLLTDPPFSKLDLIICRNFLIYLEPEAQEKSISLFHYALKDGGFLFLGNAETVGRKNSLFKSIGHKQCRIYRKLETKPAARLPLSISCAPERRTPPVKQAAPAEQGRSIVEVIQEKLLEEYGPASVAIDQNYEIIYHNGPTNRYLRQPRGVPTQDLLALVPEGLRSRIRGALYRSGREERPVIIRARIAGDDNKNRQVTLKIMKAAENLTIVVFQEKRGPARNETAEQVDAAVIEETAIHQLESELSATRADLQSHIEQLKSMNEEFQSSNEELQAANEELETSREELQSLNEELITVNSQLQGKIEEQDATNNDLNNFQASTNIPTIFLDMQFRVKRYTPAMLKLIKLLPSDVGRPIIDMSQENLGPDLTSGAQTVLESLKPARLEYELDGAWYVRTVLPYRTADNRIEGVVITYNDVSEIKRAEEEKGRLAALVASADEAIISKDLNGVIRSWNIGAENIFGYSAAEAVGRNISFLVPPGHVDEVPEIISRILRGEHIEHFESLRMRKDGTVFPASLTYSAIKDASGTVIGVSKIAHDATERKQVARAMEARLKLAEAANKGGVSARDILRLTLDELEDLTASKIGFYHFLEADQETLSLQNWSANTITNMCTAQGAGSHYSISQAGVWVDCVREKKPVIHNDYAGLPHKRGMPQGHAPVTREMVVPLFRGGLIVAIIGVGNKESEYTAADVEIARLLGDFSWEIAERKRTEEALRESEAQYRGLFENMIEGFAYCRMIFENGKPRDFIYLSVNHAFETLTGLKDVVGKNVTDVIPGIRETDQELLEIYGRVSLTGKPERFETFVKALDMWFSISVYSPEKEFFVAVFDVITERKRAEEQLARSNQRVNEILTSIQDDFYVLDRSWNFVYASRQFTSKIGKEPEDFIGNNIWEMFPNHRGTVLEENFRAAMDKREVRRFDTGGKYTDAWYRMTAFPSAEGITVLGTDVTERKKAEEALQKFNRMLKALSNSREAVIRAADETSFMRDVCRIIVEDCGFNMVWIGFAENNEAKTVRPVAHAGFASGYLETLQVTWADTERGRGPTGTAIRAGKISVCRNMLTDPAFAPWREEAVKRGYASSIVFPLRADNTVFGAITIYSREPDPFSEEEIDLLAELADDLAHGVMTLRTGAARTAAEAALKGSEERFRTLFETMTEGFSLDEIILDDTGKPVDFRYLSVNPAFERHTGLKANDIVGRTVRELFPDAEPVWFERYGKVVLTGEPAHFEERFGPLNKWFEVSAYRTEPGRFAVVFFDITERKRTEADIMTLSEGMAARNMELETANQEMESFIYSISHDLRAPIRTISGFARIIGEDYAAGLDEKGRDYLNRIEKGSTKASQLIDDLLHLSKISRQELQRTRTDLSHEASKVVEQLREMTHGRDAEVIIQKGLTALADPRLMELALSNLIGNAWKFTSKREKARIDFGSFVKDGETVFFVRDNGAGFDMTYADKMFWPFHRLHSDKEFEGTGIGLAIVERIIRRHGGRVWAEGEIDKGATMYFTLGTATRD